MNRFAAMDAFVRVVDTGSFTAAAQQLRVGQPAISKLLSQLEERVGVKLLLRTTQGLKPTEAGERFYGHARRSLEEAEEAETKARDAGTTLTGRLRVSGPVTFARLHVIPRLPHFLKEHPGLDIEILLDDGDVDPVAAGLDVALRLGELTDSSLTARKIGSNVRVVVGEPSYFDRTGVPQTPTDLISREAVIYDRRGGGTTWSFKQGAVETFVTLDGRVRVTAAEGVREAVFAGIGFAVASKWMFAPELASGRVRQVLEDWQLPGVDLWAMFATGRNASSKARMFTNFIEQELTEEFKKPPAAVPQNAV